MNIYLDNSATTPLREEVIETMQEMMKSCYGNPSSLHRLGLEAEKKITAARKTIAESLSVGKDEIYFTSGGTESNNIGIQGIIEKYSSRKMHLITTKIEHSSVLNIAKECEKKSNLDVDYVKVDKEGIVDLDHFSSLLREDTALVSIMMVNNETGSIQPIEKVRNILKEKKSSAYLHVDGVQAFGKMKLDLKALGIDLFSFSGHKIHGPKGTGGIYIKKGVALKPIIYGGGQEKDVRPGTENTIGIVGMAKALEIMNENFKYEKNHVKELKSYFLKKLRENIEDFRLNSPESENFLSNIVNLSFEGTRGEIILHSLEEKDIFISTTSACSSKDKTKSHVLEAIGLSGEEIEGSIRISFSYKTSLEEIDKCIEALTETVKEIRSIMRR